MKIKKYLENLPKNTWNKMYLFDESYSQKYFILLPIDVKDSLNRGPNNDFTGLNRSEYKVYVKVSLFFRIKTIFSWLPQFIKKDKKEGFRFYRMVSGSSLPELYFNKDARLDGSNELTFVGQNFEIDKKEIQTKFLSLDEILEDNNSAA